MNNPPPSPNLLQTPLERYKKALNCITAPNSLTNKNQVLEILSARDALGKLLETENSGVGGCVMPQKQT
ncbi:hypothetical protein C7B62_24925 [Pleurocapsa sp. CCALA 161]|nr:hypothetical protein C7B62_24925 [Pleurocapsa sp. CCALA 161]